jgi:hypothetical protein
METDTPVLIERDCSNCGRPTVVTTICARPDLCHPCFGASLLAAKNGDDR